MPTAHPPPKHPPENPHPRYRVGVQPPLPPPAQAPTRAALRPPGCHSARSGIARQTGSQLPVTSYQVCSAAPGKDHLARQGGGCFKRWKGVWHVRPRCTPSSRGSPPFGLLEIGVKKGNAEGQTFVDIAGRQGTIMGGPVFPMGTCICMKSTWSDKSDNSVPPFHSYSQARHGVHNMDLGASPQRTAAVKEVAQGTNRQHARNNKE